MHQPPIWSWPTDDDDEEKPKEPPPRPKCQHCGGYLIKDQGFNLFHFVCIDCGKLYKKALHGEEI